jgi:hypothetical protein
MAESSFAPEDQERAMDLLPGLALDDPVIDLVARAVSTERRSHADDAVSVQELRIAHDNLWAISDGYRPTGLIHSLAAALLSRGVSPAPGDYDGSWWLWWPQEGRGPCPSCRKVLQLRRYSPLTGRGGHRYLCRPCRAREYEALTEELNRVTGITPEPDESADSLLSRRMRALIQQEEPRSNRPDGRYPS